MIRYGEIEPSWNHLARIQDVKLKINNSENIVDQNVKMNL